MDYLFCFLLPPLAILAVGRPFLAIISIPLCVLFWIPGVILAILVVNAKKADDRHRALVEAINPELQRQRVAEDKKGCLVAIVFWIVVGVIIYYGFGKPKNPDLQPSHATEPTTKPKN